MVARSVSQQLPRLGGNPRFELQCAVTRGRQRRIKVVLTAQRDEVVVLRDHERDRVMAVWPRHNMGLAWPVWRGKVSQRTGTIEVDLATRAQLHADGRSVRQQTNIHESWRSRTKQC